MQKHLLSVIIVCIGAAGAALRPPCTAQVAFDPPPPQSIAEASQSSIYTVKTLCRTDDSDGFAYDGLFYDPIAPLARHSDSPITIDGSVLQYGGTYEMNPLLVVVIEDMVSDYLAGLALWESLQAAGISAQLERALPKADASTFLGRSGMRIPVASAAGQQQFEQEQYAWASKFHVLLRVPTIASHVNISRDEFDAGHAAGWSVSLRDGNVVCITHKYCVQQRPVGSESGHRVRYAVYDHIAVRLFTAADGASRVGLLDEEAAWALATILAEAEEIMASPGLFQILSAPTAERALPLNLLTQRGSKLNLPNVQYKLAVVHASTGETLATTSAMSTSSQPAVDVAIVYRSQYTESSLVEEVRAVLDAAGMSYDLVDISRVSLVELVLRTATSMADSTFLLPTTAAGLVDDAVFAALVSNGVPAIISNNHWRAWAVDRELSAAKTSYSLINQLAMTVNTRKPFNSEARELELNLLKAIVEALEEPSAVLLPLNRLRRLIQGQPLLGGQTLGQRTRTQLIAAISQKMGYSEYLEIGCENDLTFQHIHLDRVVGVDPAQGGNVRLPSDDYFVSYHGPQLETYFAWRSQHLPDTPTLHLTAMEATKYDVTDPAVWGSFLVDRSVGEVRSGGPVVGGVSDVRAGGSFDIVFVDGLHEWKQALRDVEHALAVLKPNGTIVVHDLSARTEFEAMTPQMPRVVDWNGDTWRAGVALRARPDLDMVTSSFDHGCGVIRVRPNTNQLILPEPDTYATMTWEELDAQREAILRIRGWDEIMAWL